MMKGINTFLVYWTYIDIMYEMLLVLLISSVESTLIKTKYIKYFSIFRGSG